MFTVKVLRPSLAKEAPLGVDNRDEQIYEAREVSRDERGILMQTEAETLLLAQTGYLMSLDTHAACGQSNMSTEIGRQGNNVSVYVMNRFGATVATYHF